MILDKCLQFFLLLQHRSSLLVIDVAMSPPSTVSVATLFALVVVDLSITHEPCDIIPLLFIVASLISSMVHTKHATQYSCASQVVHCEVGTALVLIFQKCEAFALARFFVANQVDMDGLSILRENGHNITLR